MIFFNKILTVRSKLRRYTSGASNAAGMTLLETLVASAILAIGVMISIQAVSYVQKQTTQIKSTRAKDNIVTTLVNQLRSDIDQYQITFTPMDPKEALNALDDKPFSLAWDFAHLVPESLCTNCPGRMAYMITPLSTANLRGLYLVSIKLKHPEISQDVIKYQFLISRK